MSQIKIHIHSELAERLLAGGVELPFNHHLSRDAGVVKARLPQSGVAAHAMQTREGVHDRVLECVTHVQRAGHVGRWNHDTEAGRAGSRRKIAGRLPMPIETLFDFGGRVDFIHQGSVADC